MVILPCIQDDQDCYYIRDKCNRVAQQKIAGPPSQRGTDWNHLLLCAATSVAWIFFFFLSFLSVQIPSEYFTFLAVQIYSFGFLSRLIMSGPDLLGGYGDSLETQWLTSWEAQERWALQAHVGHMGVAFWNRVKQKGLWEEGFAVFGGWGSPWFLSKDVIGFFESTRNLTRKHYTAILSGNASGAFNMEVCCYRTLSGGAERGEKLRVGHSRLSQIYHMSTQCKVLILAIISQQATPCLHTQTHTHTHINTEANTHDWGELNPWTWMGGPWMAAPQPPRPGRC